MSNSGTTGHFRKSSMQTQFKAKKSLQPSKQISVPLPAPPAESSKERRPQDISSRPAHHKMQSSTQPQLTDLNRQYHTSVQQDQSRWLQQKHPEQKQ